LNISNNARTHHLLLDTKVVKNKVE